MKRIQGIRTAVVAALLSATPFAVGQEATVTTRTETAAPAVTSTRSTVVEGRVGTVSPDMFVMESASGTAPVRYRFTRQTTYVDEAGAPVTVDVLRSGVPVTVHYSRAGEDLVADRVIVHRRTTTTTPATVERRTVVEEPVRKPAVIEEKKTTTTTTTTEPVKKKKVEVDVDEDD